MKAKPRKIIFVCGDRPNFMKVAPVWREMKKYPIQFALIILHTVQHCDRKMSDLFFSDLELPEPDIHVVVAPRLMQSRQQKSGPPLKKYFSMKSLTW